MDRQTIENFFKGACSIEEAARVYKWLKSLEGQKYLAKKMDKDIDLLLSKRLELDYPELDSKMVLNSILNKMEKLNDSDPKKREILIPFLRFTAVISVFLISFFFYYSFNMGPDEDVESQVPLHFETADNSQKELTLTDGSKIRLNSNSELWIPDDFSDSQREVILDGEAFFEVVTDRDNSFLVHTQNTTVQALGTAFNVKASSGEDHVQVAVVEGSVSVTNMTDEPEKQSLVLEKNQFGYIDLRRNQFVVEEYSVENYLSWMSGRFRFDALPLGKVCLQLERLFDIHCDFAMASLMTRTLTANFQTDSLEELLEIISLSIDIDYELKGNQLTWKQ